ncbi:MAG: hypothetical protein ACHQ6T_12500 [Myxococcota bacterium]
MAFSNSKAESTALAAAALLLGTCVVLWLAGWWTQGFVSAWPRFEDDAYYYLVIARNAASGRGFTADGLSPTNGFQPLWMWLLVPIAWLTSGEPTRLLAAAQLVVVFVFAASGALLWDLLRSRLGFLPALLGTAVVFVPRFTNVLVSGMESGVAVLLLVMLLRDLAGRARSWRTGALLGLLMLARLDSVFVGAALAGYLGAAGMARGPAPLVERALHTAREALRVFWPTVALVAPYLAWNILAFGHVVPISGALKTSHSELGWTPENLNPAYLALLALAVAGGALLWRRAADRRLGEALLALTAGLVLHALHSVVFMRWAVFAWHFALFIPVGAVGAAALAREAQQRLPRPALPLAAAAVAALLVAVQAAAILRLPLTFTGAGREAGEWVARTLPADAVLAMKDSGAFSYYARRRVMNLDGVVNSFEFAETVCRGELADFLRAHHVEYVAQHSVPPDVRGGNYESFTQRYPCHLSGGRDSDLVLRREREVYRGSPYRDYTGQANDLIIWRVAEPAS